MPNSDTSKNKVGFIHIPKTAGITIKKTFENTDYNLISELHFPYSKFVEKHGDVDLIFSVVRNPFDRIFSFYHFFLSNELNLKFLLGLDKDYQISFNQFVNQIKYFHPFIKPCWDFISLDGVQKVDNILKFEKLGADFNSFISQNNLELELVSKQFHKNDFKPKLERQNIYKPYMVDLIYHVFRKDFENFEYSYESWLGSSDMS